jgi:hypothetical protein
MSRAPRRKRRTFNTRLIKRELSYSVQDVVGLLGVHANTVRNWFGLGLKTIDAGRPACVHGTDLIAFLDRRRAERKRHCETDELFCFRCQQPRKAWEGLVEISARTPAILNLSGVCSICSTRMNKAGSARRRAEYEAVFVCTLAAAARRICEDFQPAGACDLETAR